MERWRFVKEISVCVVASPFLCATCLLACIDRSIFVNACLYSPIRFLKKCYIRFDLLMSTYGKWLECLEQITSLLLIISTNIEFQMCTWPHNSDLDGGAHINAAWINFMIHCPVEEPFIYGFAYWHDMHVICWIVCAVIYFITWQKIWIFYNVIGYLVAIICLYDILFCYWYLPLKWFLIALSYWQALSLFCGGSE